MASESLPSLRDPMQLAPWETGLIGYITGVLALILFPAVYPTPFADGLIPNALLLSPVRLGHLYFVLSPLVVLPPALLTTALHAAANRLLRGGFPRVNSMLFMVLGMALTILWAAAIYRKDPDRRRLERSSPTAHSPPFAVRCEFGIAWLSPKDLSKIECFRLGADPSERARNHAMHRSGGGQRI